jgi:guanylate kinase
MNKERNLLVVSGPSGAGKDTVVKKMMEKHPEIEISVSATTRAMRPGEQDGVDYYFLDNPTFEQKLAQGEMLEHVNYCGKYYGTPKAEVDRRINADITVVLVIEVVGAANIKQLYPECTLVFILPPSMDELNARLRGRGTEDDETIAKRLQRAREELAHTGDYDFSVVNDDVERCADELYAILRARQQ